MLKLDEKIRSLMACRKKCLQCSLLGKIPVIASGNKNPDILFVGINPGKEEAIQGRPFVGKSGQLLRETIKSVGLNKYKIAFTNAILCSTNNEKEIPNVEECISNCKGLVTKIFRTLNPTLYVPVGSNCAKFVFGMTGNITKQSGYPLEDKINVVPIIHPASLLYSRDPQTEAKFAFSLKRIKQYLDSELC